MAAAEGALVVGVFDYCHRSVGIADGEHILQIRFRRYISIGQLTILGFGYGKFNQFVGLRARNREAVDEEKWG